MNATEHIPLCLAIDDAQQIRRHTLGHVIPPHTGAYCLCECHPIAPDAADASVGDPWAKVINLDDARPLTESVARIRDTPVRDIAIPGRLNSAQSAVVLVSLRGLAALLDAFRAEAAAGSADAIPSSALVQLDLDRERCAQAIGYVEGRL